MDGDLCPAQCGSTVILQRAGSYFDIWDEEHQVAWQCPRCGRLFSDGHYDELVRVWPDRVVVQPCSSHGSGAGQARRGWDWGSENLRVETSVAHPSM